MQNEDTQTAPSSHPRFTLRDLSQIAAAGVGAAVLDLLVKRTVGAALVAVPFSGSLFVSFPRTVLILLVVCRTRKPGTILLISLLEGVLNLTMGGLFPLTLLCPVGSGLAGEAAWLTMRFLTRRRLVSLLCTGAALAGARLPVASAFSMLLGLPLVRWFRAAPHLAAAVIAANFLLGALAGALAEQLARELQTIGLVADERADS
ncbi:MAG TPA: hypothetical protein HPP77_08390 [Candidatus Hydrogenedentes bacterium]|nr:hypothetical protein [Candidatus Hydrogenedentota bacterium]